MFNAYEIGIRRLGIIPSFVREDKPVSPTKAVAFASELSHLGFCITNFDQFTDSVVEIADEILPVLVKMRGGGRQYAPLFAGFPDKLPRFDDAELRFSMATLRWIFGAPVEKAMDFSSIGWWPASSIPQNIEQAVLDETRQALLPADDHVEWIDLRFVDPDEFAELLTAYFRDLAYSPSSLREEIRDELVEFIDLYGLAFIDLDKVRFSEIRMIFVARLFSEDPKAFAQANLSPDDILRLFAHLTGGDVSLSEKIKFPKLSRPQRRQILSALEASPRLRDVFRRRDLWLKIQRSLHIGETSAYPKVQAVFTDLRTNRHDHESTRSRFEALMSAGSPGRAAFLLANEAPGVLIRELRRIAAHQDAALVPDAITSAVGVAALKVPIRVLTAARAQLLDNGETYPRLAITKGGKALRIDQKPGHLALAVKFRDRLVSVIDIGIQHQLSAKSSWENEKIWIAPGLSGLSVPDQLRTTSDGLLQLDRGSRLPVGSAPVLRLFTYWKQAEGQYSDLDLSAIFLNEGFEMVDWVSWTNLRSGDAAVHSGDLTSAPHGAVEFIDLKLDSIPARARYVAPQIYVYSGPKFSDLPEAMSGWMMRDKTSNDRKTFDAKTVVNAFRLDGSQGAAFPFVYDVKTREIVYLDVYLNRGGWGARVERNGVQAAEVAQALVTRSKLRLSIPELIDLNVKARGGQFVFNSADATITVGTDDDCTYNALRPQSILTDLL